VLLGPSVILRYNISVHTLVNGNIQGLAHRKQQTS